MVKETKMISESTKVTIGFRAIKNHLNFWMKRANRDGKKKDISSFNLENEQISCWEWMIWNLKYT